jgi:DNA-binding response OmpR family regulator
MEQRVENMAKEKILVVDDEAEIRDLIEKYLLKENMSVTKAENGGIALSLIEKNDFDLVILDVMMEGLDGFEVLKIIRSKNQYLHVIILSARDEDYDKVLGLGFGADDYITKPFSHSEFVARVKSQLRRSSVTKSAANEEPELVVSGEFMIDLKSFEATKNNVKMELSARELKLFKFFLENPERVFTKRQIYENVWEDNYFDDNSLMVYIRHVREKIENDPNNPEYIITVRGIGYKYTLKGNGK